MIVVFFNLKENIMTAIREQSELPLPHTPIHESWRIYLSGAAVGFQSSHREFFIPHQAPLFFGGVQGRETDPRSAALGIASCAIGELRQIVKTRILRGAQRAEDGNLQSSNWAAATVRGIWTRAMRMDGANG
jgi:hypothetical protein